MSTETDWRTVTLPDGRTVEYVWTEYDGEALDVGVGHRRFQVTCLVDGEVASIPVVMSPELIAEVMDAAQRDSSGGG